MLVRAGVKWSTPQFSSEAIILGQAGRGTMALHPPTSDCAQLFLRGAEHSQQGAMAHNLAFRRRAGTLRFSSYSRHGQENRAFTQPRIAFVCGNAECNIDELDQAGHGQVVVARHLQEARQLLTRSPRAAGMLLTAHDMFSAVSANITGSMDTHMITLAVESVDLSCSVRSL